MVLCGRRPRFSSTQGLTFGGVSEHQGLQVAPLRVQPLHQLEGVDRVAQEALWVLDGRDRQGVQLIGPPDGGGGGLLYLVIWGRWGIQSVREGVSIQSGSGG